MAESSFQKLMALALGFLQPRCLHVVAELGVADHLGESPLDAEALAGATGANADALARMLRLLASAGVFESRGDAWAHTELSRLLRSDHPQSMREYVRMIGGRRVWLSFIELQHSAQTGRPVIEKYVSGGTWAYFRSNPDAARQFDAAMHSRAREEIAALLRAFDFSRYKLIADIGGGRGHILEALLAAAPASSGILFDQPEVVAELAPRPRITVQGGDFLEGPLPVADAYIVGNCLHNWDDESAMRILRAVRRAAPERSQLLVLESMLPEGPEPHLTKILDVQMLAFVGGRERTQREYEALLGAAGFRLERVVPTSCPTSILVADPV
jgi:hypothetical protein